MRVKKERTKMRKREPGKNCRSRQMGAGVMVAVLIAGLVPTHVRYGPYSPVAEKKSWKCMCLQNSDNTSSSCEGQPCLEARPPQRTGCNSKKVRME